MGKKRERALERLEAAREERLLVNIERGFDVDEMEGYVLDIGPSWVLLAILDPDIVLDGYAFLRLEDVRRVRGRNTADMVERALTYREQWPPARPAVPYDLSGTAPLLESLQELPLVTIHPEDNDPTVAFVGALAGLSDRFVRLHEVTPRGVWNGTPTKHRLNAITPVEIGGRYEEALLSVAGERPAASDRDRG